MVELRHGVGVESNVGEIDLGSLRWRTPAVRHQGGTNRDALSSLASRLSRLDKQCGPDDIERVVATGGTTLQAISHAIVEALDPDRQISAAHASFQVSAGQEPTEAQTKRAADTLIRAAVAPLATQPTLRQLVQDLPEGWCWTTIGVFDVAVGATPGRDIPEYWGGGIPWVSSGEVDFCRIKCTRETITQLGLESSSTKLNPAGTVLIGMIGEGKTRGQVAILDIPACNNQNAAAIRVSEAGLPPEYAYYYLAQQYEQNRMLGAGNNQKALNKARVEAIPFPLPPSAEQHRICKKLNDLLSAAGHLEGEVKSNAVRCQRLRQSILKWAFEGKLTEQDPRDEPASILLERIRTERNAPKLKVTDPPPRGTKKKQVRA